MSKRASSTYLPSLSRMEGGRGVALRQQTSITQLGIELPLGQSPGPGTSCYVFLATNGDHAYDNATLNFYVKQFGRLALYSVQTISPADNANQAALVYEASGYAADYWEVTIVLNGGTTPAGSLFSSVEASGVEDIPRNDGSSTPGTMQSTSTFVGPSGTGFALFSLPAGTSTWIVTVGARITASGVDPVGDSYVTSQTYAWVTDSAGTVLRLLPLVDASPYEAEDALMATMVVPDPGVGSGQALVSYTLPSGLDASTHTKVTVTMTLLQSLF